MHAAWQERTALLVGEDGIERLSRSTVAVVGAGGVGAFAAEMLARSGVGALILIDSDVVSESNKNRQLLALDSTIGRSKLDVLEERLLDINPGLEITKIEEWLEPDNVTTLFAGLSRPDFLIDAIDSLSPKLSLIKYCVDNAIPLVSSMGSGAKYDVTKIRIVDLSKSYNCPLAHIVRKKLRHLGISKGFPVVFSEELPQVEAIVPEEGRNHKSAAGTISYLPAAFGCACAQAAITYIIDK